MFAGRSHAINLEESKRGVGSNLSSHEVDWSRAEKSGPENSIPLKNSSKFEANLLSNALSSVSAAPLSPRIHSALLKSSDSSNMR